MTDNATEAELPREWREQRLVWGRKQVLRTVYEDLFRAVDENLLPGPVLEVGSGIGAFKAHRRGVTALDITYAPWLDIVANAEALPVAAGTFVNIVAIDVLHHVPRPLLFMEEAARVLSTGGRLILLEPAITAGSWFFYRFIHQERVDMSADPFNGEPTCSIDDPYDANQAIPTLLFTRYVKRLHRAIPELELKKVEYCSLIAYPLSGGFKSWTLLPSFMVDSILYLEKQLASGVKRRLGFRLLAVLERR